MSKSISLHPTLGVNPRLIDTVCPVCLEKGSELALLGQTNSKTVCPKCRRTILGGMNRLGQGQFQCPGCGEPFSNRYPGGKIELKEYEQFSSTRVCDTCIKAQRQGVMFISVVGDQGDKVRECSCLGTEKQKKHSFYACDAGSDNPSEYRCPFCGTAPDRVGDVEIHDAKNPPRSGRICCLKDAAVTRLVSDADMLERILKARMAFMPDKVWDAVGLPAFNAPEIGLGEGTKDEDADTVADADPA